MGSPDAWADARAITLELTMPQHFGPDLKLEPHPKQRDVTRLVVVTGTPGAEPLAKVVTCFSPEIDPQGSKLQQDDSPREQIVRINKCKVNFIVNTIL